MGPYAFGEDRISNNLDTEPVTKTLTRSGRRRRGHSISAPYFTKHVTFANNRETFANKRETFANKRETFANKRVTFANKRETFANKRVTFANKRFSIFPPLKVKKMGE